MDPSIPKNPWSLTKLFKDLAMFSFFFKEKAYKSLQFNQRKIFLKKGPKF
jgi:hypothetical protein